MAKPKILLADSDEKSLSMMTISLKKAGFNVTAGRNGEEALELVRTSQPDLIISDTKMPQMDGFTFCSKLKENPATKIIPFIFLTREKNVDDKIRGLELGVDDYLTKPIYLKEVLARVKLLLEKREKEKVDFVPQEPQFSGSLADMGVVDLIQTMELGQKTGVVYLSRDTIQSSMAFLKGRILDARVGATTGEAAVYKLLLWSEGSFRIDFKNVDDVETTIRVSTQGLIMEGMRRIDELVRIKEQLPPLESYLAIDSEMILEEHPDQFPEKIESILSEFTGKQTIQQIIDKLPFDDLESMEIIAKLYFQGFLMPVNAPEEGAGGAKEQAEEPLFDFAPPEEDDDTSESIEHIFEKNDAAADKTAQAAAPSQKEPAAPDEESASEDIPIDEEEFEETIDVEAEFESDNAAPQENAKRDDDAKAGSKKAKPKSGKVIFLKNTGAAAAKKTEASPEEETSKAPEEAGEKAPDAAPAAKAPAKKAKPAKAKEIRMPAAPPKPKPEPQPEPKPESKPEAAESPEPAEPPPAPPQPQAPAPEPVRPPTVEIPDEPTVTEQPAAAQMPTQPVAPAPAAQPAAAPPAKKSRLPLVAAIGTLVVGLAAGGGYFAYDKFLSAPGAGIGQVEFRDATLKLTGENLDIYRGASVDMNFDTASGYRRAIQGFEALLGQNGWVDGTDQEIVLSKLALSYARLSDVQEDPAPLTKARELISANLAERPNSPYLLLADAEIKTRAGDLAQGEASLKKFGPSASDFYLFSFISGLNKLKSGDVPDLAILSLRKSIQQKDEFTRGHYELAQAYEASRRLSDAITEYKKVTSLSPNHADAHFHLARIYQERSEPELALRHAETAVAVDQTYLPARALLAQLLVEKEKFEQAEPHVTSVLELARPGADDDLLVDGHVLEGRIAESNDETDRAIRAYSLALQISPEQEFAQERLDALNGGSAPAPAKPEVVAARVAPKPVVSKPKPKPKPVVKATQQAAKPKKAAGPSAADIKANREAYTAAQNLYRRGMLRNAVTRLNEGIRAVPADDKSWALLGQVYIEMERNDDALKALLRALNLNSRNAEAYLNLGGLYDTMGKTRQANQAYERYLKLEPNGKFARDIRALLSSRQ